MQAIRPANRRIAVHDFAGHPFQIQLSRELARRGDAVVHLYCPSYPNGRGRMEPLPDDPLTLSVEPVQLQAELRKYSILGRSTSSATAGSSGGVSEHSAPTDAAAPAASTASRAAIDLGAEAADYIPGISEDGVTFRTLNVTFRTLKRVAGQDSPLGTTNDGYCVSSDGHIHILTLHTTIFAVLYKANLSVSESGRKLKPASSGLFGDPTLIHPGKANLRRIGKVSIYPFAFRRLPGRAVRFSFFVDEQVAAYISVYQGGTKLPISTNGTMIGGSTLTKPGIEKNLHIVVLRPGALPIRLRIPASQLVPGKHYRIRVAVLDYDGNRTVAYVPFTG